MSESDPERALARRLGEHAEECGECRATPLPLGELARVLAQQVVAIDAVALSRRVAAALQPELARLASVWFWRRFGRGVLVALLPLPAIVALDAWLLSYVHEWAAAWLPEALATYLVVSYGALLVLLFAATYAAIPLALAREAWGRSVARLEATA